MVQPLILVPTSAPAQNISISALENFLELQQQTLELVALLDTHPMLTGKCPACGAEMEYDDRAVVHWNCPCGWTDNEI